MEIISVVNQKGGVGKTTSVINIGSCLVEKGKKVLLIDMDSQGNLSQGLGVKKYKNTIHDCLIGKLPLKEAIVKTDYGIDVIPSDMNLANVEGEILLLENKEIILKSLFNKFDLDYDYCLIDCKPALDTLTVNALTAANSILIPMDSSAFAFQGLAQLIKIIKLIQKGFNPDLKVKGVFLVRANTRTTLTSEFFEQLNNIFGDKLYKTVIYQSIAIPKSQIVGQPINVYDRKSRGFREFMDLTVEVMKS